MEWIKTSEALPDGQTPVLCYFPGYGAPNIVVCWLTDADPTRQTWFNVFWTSYKLNEATHWMILPQVPAVSDQDKSD